MYFETISEAHIWSRPREIRPESLLPLRRYVPRIHHWQRVRVSVAFRQDGACRRSQCTVYRCALHLVKSAA